MSDTPPQPEPFVRFRPIAELVHALRFLSRLPLPRTLDLPPLAQSMRMFSVAGAIIGALIGGTLLLAEIAQLPPLLAGSFAAFAGMLLTGALHEDGLADTADGLGGGRSRDRRLEIMRDSRIGAYGALALCMSSIARVAAYAALLPLPTSSMLAIVIAVHAFSRAMVVDLVWATSPARSDGLAAYAGRPTRSMAALAVIIGLSLTLGTGYFVRPESGAVALAAALLVTAIFRRMAVRLIGGITGDVCGAVQVGSEVAMLTAFVAMNH